MSTSQTPVSGGAMKNTQRRTAEKTEQILRKPGWRKEGIHADAFMPKMEPEENCRGNEPQG